MKQEKNFKTQITIPFMSISLHRTVPIFFFLNALHLSSDSSITATFDYNGTIV